MIHDKYARLVLDRTTTGIKDVYVWYAEPRDGWLAFKLTKQGRMKYCPSDAVIMVERVSEYEYEKHKVESNEEKAVMTDGGMHEDIDTIQCNWCEEWVSPDEIRAVKPKNHAVMMCSNCMPEPPRDTDDRYHGLDQMKQRAERWEDQELYRNQEFQNQVL